MSELVVILEAVSLARTLINEGSSALKSYQTYVENSKTLSTAEKETIINKINGIAEEVKDSKFKLN